MASPIVKIHGNGIQEIGRLRHEVWREKGIDVPQVWLDAADESAVHFACCEDGHIIAAVRVTFHATALDLPHQEEFRPHLALLEPLAPFAYLSRLVVSERFAGLGYGTRLVRHTLLFAAENLASTVLALAVDDVQEWFGSLGFGYGGKGGLSAADQPNLVGMQAHVMFYPLCCGTETEL